MKYHEDFEKSKGKLTQVADDPETVRIRNTHKIISNVAYHGDLEKKQEMEKKRTLVPNESSVVNQPSLNSHNNYAQVTQQLQEGHHQQQLMHQVNQTNGNSSGMGKQSIRYQSGAFLLLCSRFLFFFCVLDFVSISSIRICNYRLTNSSENENTN